VETFKSHWLRITRPPRQTSRLLNPHDSTLAESTKTGTGLAVRHGDNIANIVHAGSRFVALLFLLLLSFRRPPDLVPLLTTTRVLTARDLTIEAAQSASSSGALRSTGSVRNSSSAQIKKLLDSRNDRDILEGLRKVISVWSIVRHTFGLCARC
jgi:hypothetical protein